MKNIAIQLNQVYKTYQLRHEKPTLVETVFGTRKQEIFTALDNFNLTVGRGEKLGITGSNGAGKTTLLKVIAGITTPDSGQVITHGRIVSLISLDAGFEPDLTGEENIYLNGLIIGMNRKEVENQFDTIVKFADIGRFIDAPLYTYSSGMKLRLGFSVAVHANPDILILDEAITVGDSDFQKKAGKKIEAFFKQKKTVLVVTHWQEFLDKHCGRQVRIKNGKVAE